MFRGHCSNYTESLALERGGSAYPLRLDVLYTEMTAISSNAQRRHLSLFLP